MYTKQYCGIKVRQRMTLGASEFFVFAASAKDVAAWATIDRLEDRAGGIQRRLSPARRRAIKRFFDQDPRNVIPTSIVLAFLPGVARFTNSPLVSDGLICDNWTGGSLEWGVLTFQYDPDCAPSNRPAFVVDGQHRLLGSSDVEEGPFLLISALLDAEPDEQAFQFIVINNKASRVNSDLVRSLIVDFDERALQQRLEAARVSLGPQAFLVAIIDDDPESPFYQMIAWERRRGTGTPAVRPAAIEDSLKYIRHRFPSLDEDQDALIDFFYGLWNGVRSAYPQLWRETDNRLFDNAGFKAFSEFLTDEIETLTSIDFVDIDEIVSVAKASETIARQINPEFWLAEWNLKSLDTSSGREIIKDDIKRIRQRRKDETRDWNDGFRLVGVHEE
jgi:DGQHR domain-containing protein